MTADMKWKLVPVEADDGMIEAGHEKLLEGSEWGRMVSAAEIYDAMLAASPPAPGAEPVAKEGPGAWLIRKGSYYYRPNRSGYTASKAEAGRYTEAEAKREAAIEPWHMSAILADDVPGPSTHPIDPAAIRAEARREALEEAARTAAWAHMVPPDGGSPSDDECMVAARAASAIRALIDKEPGR